MTKTRVFIAAALIAVLSAFGGMAFAATVFTKPADPAWMNRPCATPTEFHESNCYWNGEQMGTGAGDGIEDHFERTFKVQDWYGNVTKIQCYFFTHPTTTGSTVDHCVSPTGNQRRVSIWTDPR